ncbi:hypothetical protein PBRA_008242 [Plasmodiophora brassicae]|uniref:Uncharacterized protein n=1 Tax=Plasmodiophora brassicae TaxID=37360 RepID=A0A0G4J020_PLABS|nr:hypothetical protein PBRA_008242 [Plasmodiophora brassicae]
MLKGQTPIFTPVTPPQLNSTDYKCVTEFLTKYKKYAALIEDRRNRHSQDIYPEAMKSCMPDRILNSIAKFRIRKPVQNITDDDIKGYLVKIQREALCEDMNDCDIDELIRKTIVMDMKIGNCEARVNAHFGKFDQFIEDHGLESHFSGSDAKVKRKIKLLRKGIRPEILRKQLKKDMKYGNYEHCWKDEMAFFDLVDKRAKEQNLFFPKKVPDDNNNRKNGKTTNARSNGKNEPHSTTKNDDINSPKKKLNGKNETNRIPEHEGKQPPEGGCAFCQGPHWLPMCPKVSKTERQELLKKMK